MTIVIPSYRNASMVGKLVASSRRTSNGRRVRIVVADDATGPEYLAPLEAIKGIEVVAGDANVGFAATVNRGRRATDPKHDVVLLNSDVIAQRGWLASLQFAATDSDEIGIVGPRLLYDDGIQYGGTVRKLGAPEWLDHRYRVRPAAWRPARAGDGNESERHVVPRWGANVSDSPSR